MDSWARDIRYAGRRLMRSPAFTLVAIFSLAIGIGANTALFSVVNSILIRDLPMDEPAEVVEIYTSAEDGAPYGGSSYLDLDAMRNLDHVFEGVSGYATLGAHADHGDRVSMIFGEAVSHDLFALLGVRPVLGRSFLPEEGTRASAENVLVLGHGYWIRQMGADPQAVGRTLRLNGESFTVVGVMPRELQSLTVPGVAMDFFVPLVLWDRLNPTSDHTSQLDARGNRHFALKGRLRPGVSVGQASAALATLSSRLQEEFPGTNEGREFTLIPSSEVAVHPELDKVLVPVAGLLLVVVGIVLLIACTNLAGFLLARAADRQKEIALRLALGARRSTLIRQLLAETVLMGLGGGLAGLLVAYWTLRALMSVQPPIPITLSLDVGLDERVLLFTLVVSVGAGLLFGLAPAVQGTTPALTPALKGEGGIGRSLGRFNLRNTLIGGQIALSVVLLVGSGLFLRSLQFAQNTDLGFSARHGAIALIDTGISGPTENEMGSVLKEVRERARRIVGVEAVGIAQTLPLGLVYASALIEVPEVEPPPGQDYHDIPFNRVDRGFLDALGLTLTSGRWFGLEDNANSESVVVISESMARRFWPGEEPLGRTVIDASGAVHRVIGVMKDAKLMTIGENATPHMYALLDQHPASTLHIVARGSGEDSGAVASQLRAIIQETDRELVIVETKTIGEHLAIMLFLPRMAAFLLGVFGAVALVLAAVGLYGVVSYAVARRSREIGIRMSLGADASSVVRMVLRGSLGLVLAGSVIGLAVAFGLSQLISSYLIGIGSTDLVTFVGVPLLLGGVAIAASVAPAQKAIHMNPVEAIRTE
jgi:predicted permease